MRNYFGLSMPNTISTKNNLLSVTSISIILFHDHHNYCLLYTYASCFEGWHVPCA